MKISDISIAKGSKIKLIFQDTSTKFTKGSLLRIELTQNEREFIINQYGQGICTEDNRPLLCETDSLSAEYIVDLLNTEKSGTFRCLYSVEGINNSSIEVQAYTFKSVTKYKTTIFIQVPEKLLEKTAFDKLYKEYVWDQLGEPAVFCLNYKNRKKQNADVRFISGRKTLIAHNTPRGIIAESEYSLKNRDYQPIDIYVAPEIRFVPVSENSGINGSLAVDLDKVSNPQSYFARWEAYNELSKKLLEKESEEFGELHYSSYTMKTDLTGITFEFYVNEELDEFYKGKELGASESTDPDAKESYKRPKQTAAGSICRISGNRITTYLERVDSFDVIPKEGSLTLYTAGDKFIIARRDAARERMIKHQSPIKSIVALIEAGVSEYELPSDWGSHKAVTEELKKNFKKAVDLNPEQIAALNIAINTPDIALIQGPPGTGKTTVIKAICERFREIYEAEQRQQQKLNEDHILRSPKILISSFQNEAVDNAISTPLPGYIPAYRKTAKRAKDSTKEQYQKALDNWYSGVSSSIRDLIEDKAAAEYVKAKKILSDKYLSYKNSGELLELAAELIHNYLSFSEIHYPSELLDAANAVFHAVDNDLVADDLPDPIEKRLKSQRLDADSFADDGQRNAKKLVSHLRIRDDLDISESATMIIQKVCEEDFSEEDFTAYVKLIEGLKDKFCKEKAFVDVKDKAVVNECLVAMAECFNNQYMNTLTDIESKKSLILSEFLSRLEQEYEAIVKKYSMTTAATCQTCLDIKSDSRQIFDLVIIDEAARANPLDLFIPMSMGRKIVLVGDHKQLPHMLEPDVLKIILDDPKFKDLPEIEKSLFERLFGMFAKGQKPKAILLTHQFRMHPEICKFVSDAFYEGQLKTSEKITPEDRSSPNEINDGRALTFVNIPATCGTETPGVSKSRRVEVEAVSKEVKRILEIDPNATVGVITFYATQATKIKQSLDMTLNTEEMNHVEVGTVDAFQGKEFGYVLLSCVRSNIPKREGELPSVGFLEKPNRLCVAFSRAIRQLIVFGDADTLIQIPCFSKLYGICAIEGGGCYREY
ncbi:DEAD/DEAH box helicase [Macellibacteroides fermentans]|uniref:DEAD/DEAH box helicase n=1 Tax=Macellibacteroides fermentans TaxID=879969 RepID=UPI00406C10C2